MFRCLFNKKDEVIDIKALEKINVCKVCGKQFDLIKENINEINRLIIKNPELYKKIMDPMIAYTEYTA